jgi:hypothetical protein
VKSFTEAPNIAVDELGDVSVDCPSLADARCLRALMDEACLAGGNVVHSLKEESGKLRGKVAHSTEGKRGPRPAGCDVASYPEAPPMPTDNIGPVSASCTADTSDDECIRAMKDEACKLGGDVVWGVVGPEMRGGKKHVDGRAAVIKR